MSEHKGTAPAESQTIWGFVIWLFIQYLMWCPQARSEAEAFQFAAEFIGCIADLLGRR
jgi:hypothetical protein